MSFGGIRFVTVDIPLPKIALVVGIVSLLHCALWFSEYNQTALGISPALDNRQTLELARSMSEGVLPEEVFHRAPFYPYLLSIPLSMGLPFESLPLLARLINALALAMISATSALIAGRLWHRSNAAWFAGLLVALNPVLVFFAGDAFDILLATAFLNWGVLQAMAWQKTRETKTALLVGLFLAIGSALRSHLLPLALLWPIVVFITSRERRPLNAAIAAFPLLISFLALGYANLQNAGEFRMLPWQGSYSLWAGNKPGASGRIYTQSLSVQFSSSYDNPAKLESIALYEQETGNQPPHDIDAMNAHWKGRFFEHITNNPGEWLALILRKCYFFLNNYEQYDNKTYSFHKERHILLNWNPIHWGMLLSLAVAGTMCGFLYPQKRPIIIALITLFTVYAAGTVLF